MQRIGQRGGPWQSRMLLTFLALIYAAGVILFLEAPTDVALLVPGPVVETRELLTPAFTASPGDGRLLATTVGAIPRTKVLDLIRSAFIPSATRVHRADMLPEGDSVQDFQTIGGQQMEESEAAAQVAALKLAGVQARLEGDGALVVDLSSTAPAGISKGDVIVGIEDRAVRTASDLDLDLRGRALGGTVLVVLLRDGGPSSIDVPVTANAMGRPTLGVATVTANPTVSPRPALAIQQTGVIGPSAGLMMALAVLERISSQPLTAGKTIAGTGTITPEGEVGPVGGVRQKVTAAERAGADYFLVPSANYQEAAISAKNMKVVAIDSLAEAAAFLRELNR